MPKLLFNWYHSSTRLVSKGTLNSSGVAKISSLASSVMRILSQCLQILSKGLIGRTAGDSAVSTVGPPGQMHSSKASGLKLILGSIKEGDKPLQWTAYFSLPRPIL